MRIACRIRTILGTSVRGSRVRDTTLVGLFPLAATSFALAPSFYRFLNIVLVVVLVLVLIVGPKLFISRGQKPFPGF